MREVPKNIGDSGAPPSWDGGVADPRKQASSHVLSNFVVQGQTLWAYIEGPKNLGDAAPPPLKCGVVDPRKHAPHVVSYQIWLL